MTAPSARRDVRGIYDAWHASIPADEQEVPPWHALVRCHLEPGTDLDGKRVLEVACGRGSLARSLMAGAARPACLVAVDFSATAIQKARAAARQAGAPAIAWGIADIEALPFAAASFDTVISCETIEHVPRPPAAIGELARVLRAGGRLFLTTPNYLNAMGAYRAYVRAVGRPYAETGQPINRLTLLPRTVGWVRRAGLRILVARTDGHYLPFWGRPPLRLPIASGPFRLLRWFGLHSLVVARKTGRG